MTTAIILGYLGAALMVGMSGLASAIGTSICGMTAVGAMKKDPSKFGTYMILSALPGSQGLYGFVAYFMIAGFLTDQITMLQGAAIFAGGIVMALVATISSYFQARVCASGIAAVGNGHDVMTRTLILAAFPELYAILGLASVFLISIAI
jgi:V/A-type H+-transporting ATPase subunit K